MRATLRLAADIVNTSGHNNKPSMPSLLNAGLSVSFLSILRAHSPPAHSTLKFNCVTRA